MSKQDPIVLNNKEVLTERRRFSLWALGRGFTDDDYGFQIWKAAVEDLTRRFCGPVEEEADE